MNEYSIYFLNEVTSSSCSSITNRIMEIGDDIGRVNIIINSSGGIIKELNGLISIIEHLGVEIVTHAIGRCESAAIDLFLCGNKRYSCPQNLFFIHEPVTTCSNASSQDCITMAKELSDLSLVSDIRIKENLKKKYLKTYKPKLYDNSYFTSEEFKELGLCTDIKPLDKRYFKSKYITRVIEKYPDEE